LYISPTTFAFWLIDMPIESIVLYVITPKFTSTYNGVLCFLNKLLTLLHCALSNYICASDNMVLDAPQVSPWSINLHIDL
jgi:hypothetical protein